MKTLKMYIIEFFVIVLGVSVSLLAEQWRQNINERSANEDMISAARKEARLLLSYDSLNPGKNFSETLKQSIDRKSIHPDTLLSILSFLETDLPLQKFIPSIFKSANSTALPPNQIHLLQSIVGNSDRMVVLGQNIRSIIRSQLYPLMDEYGVLNDYLNIKYLSMIESNEQGPQMFWKFSTLPNDSVGRYDELMRDERLLRTLRIINLHMIEAGILVVEVRYFLKRFLSE